MIALAVAVGSAAGILLAALTLYLIGAYLPL